MSMPLAKLDPLVGYGSAFAAVAAVQASLASAVAFGLLDLDVEGSIWVVLAFAVANALLGMALGLFLSALPRPSPGGAVHAGCESCRRSCSAAPRDRMAQLLEWVSWLLPMTYAYDRLARATTGAGGARIVVDMAVILGTIVVSLALGAATLRRRTA